MGCGCSSERTIDVRTIAPPHRHPLIFGTFNDLAAGQAFMIVNDHDPKPLYQQFQARYPGAVLWEYLQQGPDVWRVRIARVA
jgi:uncharacterized protein (DUF2249 family)